MEEAERKEQEEANFEESLLSRKWVNRAEPNSSPEMTSKLSDDDYYHPDNRPKTKPRVGNVNRWVNRPSPAANPVQQANNVNLNNKNNRINERKEKANLLSDIKGQLGGNSNKPAVNLKKENSNSAAKLDDEDLSLLI